MRGRELLQGLSNLSVNAVSLALRRPSQLRGYLSHCMKKYEELADRGLPCQSPPGPADDLTITIPACNPAGGMSFLELVVLARATKALNAKTVFEIGTFNGLTTAVFMLNAPADAQVFTLDLPLDVADPQTAIHADKSYITNRVLASVPAALGLRGYRQILCDSMSFDPSPYRGTINLGLVDGAHDVVHARNDTIKMSQMMDDGGLVFWHDYGGRGVLGPLSSYLEDLGTRCPVYRVMDTNLAWAPAGTLKAVVGGL